jgi:glycosyltransferase involved in cell wall biosynthesis
LKIHAWVPDYASAIGGIQTFSRFFVRGLRDLFPDSEISIFSKNDTSYPSDDANWADHFFPSGWWPARLRTAAFASTLFRAAAFERPDLILTTHVNFTPVARSLRRTFKIPYVAVAHGIEVWEMPSARLRSALSGANCLLAVSEFTRQRMATVLAMDARRIGVLPDTFDPNAFLPAEKPRFLLKRFRLTHEQPVILTIGRLAGAERYKGYDQLLHALPAIRSRFPTVRYILGGRGPDRSRIEGLIRELDLGANVSLAGYVADHELNAFYNLCDVFSMPSKGEGFGIVFLEAMSCGKAVVAGNKDGSVDAVLGGRIGALVDPDDVQEIAATVTQLLAGTHPNALLRNPAAIRERVSEAYRYEHFVQILRGFIMPLLPSGRKAQ